MTQVVDTDLTPVQARIYEAIRQCWQVYQMAPSQYELQRAVGCSSTSVQNAMRILKRKGYLSATKFAIRGARPTDMERTVLNAPPDPFAAFDDPERFWEHA